MIHVKGGNYHVDDKGGYCGSGYLAEVAKYENNMDDANVMAAASGLLRCLKRIVEELPTKRDWLDPDLEKAAKAFIAKAEGR